MLFYFVWNENFKSLVPHIYEFNFFVDTVVVFFAAVVVVISVNERLNVYYSTTQRVSLVSLFALFWYTFFYYYYYYKIEETCNEYRLRNTNESKFKFIFSFHRRQRGSNS